jgi:rhamnose utilization protein RhaD (predicted bifunctional aldolase and dehydrogenase)
MSIEALVNLSRYYGSNPEYIVAGGGNTSFKDDATLYIKSSGAALAEIRAEHFVRMDRARLAQIWKRVYPERSEEREAAVLADLLAARKPGEEQKRPSVETLLHDLLPFAYVVHTHPALVNGLTCAVAGEQAAQELFGDQALWIPSINPGYVLSLTVKEALAAQKKGPIPDIILLQNHGVFVGADSVAGIRARYQYIMDTIGSRTQKRPDLSGGVSVYRASGEIAALLRELAAKTAPQMSAHWQVCFARNQEIATAVQDRRSFYPLSSALTPDHMVYAGSDPLFIEAAANQDAAFETLVREAWEEHHAKTGRIPKIAAFQGLGVFGIGPEEKASRLALELFTDAIQVAVYAQAFGGVRFMGPEEINFINTWEVEQYRFRVSAEKAE